METLMSPIGPDKSPVSEMVAEYMMAASAPLIPAKVSSEVRVKQQVSAPSYFASLSENAAPPFRTPGKKTQPRILIGSIMSEREAVEMVAAAGAGDVPLGLWRYIYNFVVEKNITENYNLSERHFLASLVTEVTDYAAQRDFSAFKLALLITLYLDTHKFFKWYYWLTPRELWEYFVENLIRHTIEDSPDGQEVFEPDESYDILTHFHTAYVSNLPLVHIATFGATRLRLSWPFKAK
ncbi:uncharacterized protein LOC125227237 isoform X1 [Leguminivora glycinivorella]|uniref:uncharacterized protein LOC125227237 isoform X1 n=1 Tax=Leguminivora glycinivorella TaxID=1035111 RepID=UPI00200BB25E|nr:uncharacterized protein LOC125227237 isoform X1 [Leguminivora glycinivorella]